jgi:hypothetical protein
LRGELERLKGELKSKKQEWDVRSQRSKTAEHRGKLQGEERKEGQKQNWVKILLNKDKKMF